MATMVYCRGLQSHVESQFLETSWTTHIAHMKLASSPNPQQFELALKSCLVDLETSNTHDHEIPPLPSDHFKKCNRRHDTIISNSEITNPIPSAAGEKKTTRDNTSGGRDDFSQSLVLRNAFTVESKTKPPALMEKKDQEEYYVHPLVKRSQMSTLSDKSLALCTENLGSETGVDFIEPAIFDEMKNRSNVENLETKEKKRVKSNRADKKFPPPLTTISGGLDSIRIRSHRENGRLVMEAVKAPARHSYFQVERSHGRLRLSILKSSNPTINSNFDSEEKNTENEVEEDEDEERNVGDVKETGEKGNYEEDAGEKLKVEENKEREKEYKKVKGADFEIEKIERSCCRCKEGENMEINKRTLRKNWKPVWVAIS